MNKVIVTLTTIPSRILDIIHGDDGIKSCIESLQNQNYEDYEILYKKNKKLNNESSEINETIDNNEINETIDHDDDEINDINTEIQNIRHGINEIYQRILNLSIQEEDVDIADLLPPPPLRPPPPPPIYLRRQNFENEYDTESDDSYTETRQLIPISAIELSQNSGNSGNTGNTVITPQSHETQEIQNNQRENGYMLLDEILNLLNEDYDSI